MASRLHILGQLFRSRYQFRGPNHLPERQFLCAAKGVQIGIYFQKKILTGLFGGEGFIMQKLEGDGLVFIHAGGTIREVELKAGESLQVDTGCLVAMTSTVNFDIQRAGNIKSMIFGGEGLFLANVTGPGMFGCSRFHFPEWQVECWPQYHHAADRLTKVLCWAESQFVRKPLIEICRLN